MDKYTSYDLELAKELGGLTKAIQNMDEKINRTLLDNSAARDALWTKLDNHSARLDTHHGFIKWIIGVGSGIGTFLTAMIYWMTHK